MLARIRRIFLTQYIGAIVAAILTAEAISGFVSMVSYTLSWRIAERINPYPNVLGSGQTARLYDWTLSVHTLVEALLKLGVVAVLIRWLYFGKASRPLPKDEVTLPPSSP
jgi:hypothetical protein